jgi:peptide/nickel transport system substrate-binding protein
LIVPSIDTQLGMLQSGASDIMGWGITPSQAETLPTSSGIEALGAPSHAPRDVRFNLKLAPFDNIAFRRAMALSVDRKQVVNTLFDGAATAGNDAYIFPDLDWSNKALPPLEFSIEKAKATLQGAGFTWNQTGQLCFPKT